ncbi:LysR family transcriptional regulator [Falsirhodobacter sp. 20TX0035]|uniref:LysR substrate-binding domain-containing protein n=1 Tax=Falsirhodobacter sp. 20TX0035 TaxID=3022019 RepID=UPI00232DF788|nr:LysR family transcriptional regulator [Falsirhodobacter sp. 20TX0035]MDB6454842.1 LysR family transcriptional regulator [Falsirhodobacter sp. 20TX0035]
MLELRHYRYLAAIRDELSFVRAAQRLGISVPTLSVQVRHAEDHVGFPIFERTSRRVRPTRTGALFLRSVDQVLQAAGLAEAVAGDLLRGMGGEVRLGYVGSAAYSGVLQRLVRAFEEACPSATLIAEEHVMEDLPRMVAEHRLDLALVRAPVRVRAGLVGIGMSSDHFVAAISTRLPLPEGDYVRSQDLHDLPFILPEQVFGTEEVGRRGQFQPRVILTPGSLVAVLTQVALRNAVAIIPSMLRNTIQLEGVTFREIDGPQILSGITGVGRANEDTPVVARLLELAAALPPD